MGFDLSKFRNWVLDWVMPRYCYGCGIEGELFCKNCCKSRIEIKNTQECPDCRMKSGDGVWCDKCIGNWNIDGLIVCCEKNDVLAKLVSEFKYKDIYSLDEILGNFFIQESFGRKFEMADFVTSVPLERKRFWWRGYNQAELLARQVSARFNISYCDVINRNFFTKQQVGLSRKERFENVKDVFDLNNRLDNKVVLLVDDVCTTMATLEECAKKMKENGAKKVYGIVLARGL